MIDMKKEKNVKGIKGFSNWNPRLFILHIFLFSLFFVFLFGFNEYLLPVAIAGAYIAIFVLEETGFLDIYKSKETPYEEDFICKFTLWKKNFRTFYFFLLLVVIVSSIWAFFGGNESIAMLASSFCGAFVITTILGFLGLLDIYSSKGV